MCKQVLLGLAAASSVLHKHRRLLSSASAAGGGGGSKGGGGSGRVISPVPPMMRVRRGSQVRRGWWACGRGATREASRVAGMRAQAVQHVRAKEQQPGVEPGAVSVLQG